MEDVKIVDPTGSDLPSQVQEIIELSDSMISCIKISPTGVYVAVGTVDGYILLYNFTTRNFESVWPAHSTTVGSLSWSGGNGDILASTAFDWCCKLWNLKTILNVEPATLFSSDNATSHLLRVYANSCEYSAKTRSRKRHRESVAAKDAADFLKPSIAGVKDEDTKYTITSSSVKSEQSDTNIKKDSYSESETLKSLASIIEKRIILENKPAKPSLFSLAETLPLSSRPLLLHEMRFDENAFQVCINPKRLCEMIVLRHFSYPVYIKLACIDSNSNEIEITQNVLKYQNEFNDIQIVERRIVIDFDTIISNGSKTSNKRKYPKKNVKADDKYSIKETPSLFAAFERSGEYFWVTFLKIQFLCRVPVSDVLLNSPTGTSIVKIPGTRVNTMSFNKSAEDFVLNCQDKSVRLCLFDSNIFEIGRFSNSVESTPWCHSMFTARGRYIIAATLNAEDHHIFIWEKDGRLVKRLEASGIAPIEDIDYHPIRPMMLTLSNGAVTLWNHIYEQNFSGFDPTFREISENIEYDECEDEFDNITVSAMFVPRNTKAIIDKADGSLRPPVRYRNLKESNEMELREFCNLISNVSASRKRKYHSARSAALLSSSSEKSERKNSIDILFDDDELKENENIDITTLDPDVEKYIKGCI